MEDPGEELEADDGVDDDDEDDEEGDVEQRDHRHEDGVQDNLGGKGLMSGNDFFIYNKFLVEQKYNEKGKIFTILLLSDLNYGNLFRILLTRHLTFYCFQLQ